MLDTKFFVKLGLVAFTPAALMLAAYFIKLSLTEPESDGDPYRITFDVSPDGKSIVFSSDTVGRDLYLFDLKSKRTTQLTDTKDIENYPSFSPDGKFIVYTVQAHEDASRQSHESGSSNIFVRSVDGRQVQQLTMGDDMLEEMPSFSRDGTKIVFTRFKTVKPEGIFSEIMTVEENIYLMNRDGSKLKRVTNDDYSSLNYPKFSHDDSSIVFSSDSGEPPLRKLFQITLDGFPAPRLLTPNRRGQIKRSAGGSLGTEPDVSPDGRHIAFFAARERAGENALYLMSWDGKNLSAIWAPPDQWGQSPAFSSDGKSIFFLNPISAPHDGFGWPKVSLWRVETNGKNAYQVADSTLFSDPLSWNKTG